MRTKDTEEVEHDDTDLKLDPDALDVEWLEQPNLYRRYAKLAAKAIYEAKRAEENMKTVRSEIILELNDLEKKPAAHIMESMYRVDKRYIRAKEDMHKAFYRAEKAEGIAKALYMRRDALENLVVLEGRDYFAGPSEPRNLSKEWESARGRAITKIKNRRADKA